MNISRYIALAVAFVASVTAQAQTQVPNTFQSGQAARAADVNANFDAVEAAIDSNSARIDANASASQNNALSISQLGGASGIPVFDQNGAELGKFIGMRRVNADDPVIYVLNERGFVFPVSTDGDPAEYIHTGRFHYTQQDCTGDVYMTSAAWFSTWMGHVGTVVAMNRNGQRTLYSIRGDRVTRTYESPGYSYLDERGQCNNPTGLGTATTTMWPVTPNDEAVTGVSETPPTGLLSLGSPRL